MEIKIWENHPVVFKALSLPLSLWLFLSCNRHFARTHKLCVHANEWTRNLPPIGLWTGLRRYWFLWFSEWHCEKFTMSGELLGFHSSCGSSSMDFITQIHLTKSESVRMFSFLRMFLFLFYFVLFFKAVRHQLTEKMKCVLNQPVNLYAHLFLIHIQNSKITEPNRTVVAGVGLCFVKISNS